MKNSIKFLLAITTLFAFFACNNNENDARVEDLPIKQFVFHHGEKTFTVDYKIENGALELVSELPKELNQLKNSGLKLHFADTENIYLVNKAAARTTIDPDFADYANFYKPFKLEKVNNYAYVVKNIEQAKIDYTEQFGLKKCWYKPNLVQKQYFINGIDVDYTVDLVFGFKGDKQYEVLESNTNGNGIFGDFLQQQEGFHHIGFGVDNLPATTALFVQAGYNPILSGEFKTKMGLVSKLSFFDTRAEVGAYTEVVESRLFGFSVEQNEALYIFGLLLTDVKLECIK